MQRHKKGMLLASCGALFWGGSGVSAQFLLQDRLFSPESLVAIRMLAAGLLLLGIDAIQQHGHKGNTVFAIWQDRHSIGQLLIFAFIGMLGVQYTYFAAIAASNAATASILQYLMPVLIVLWTSFSTHRLPQMRESVCVLLAVMGTFLLVTHGRLDALAISSRGLGWGLLSAAASAFYTIQPKQLLLRWRSPLVIGWSMLLGGLALLPLQASADNIYDPAAILNLFYIIIFGTVIAFWAYLESTKYIKASETGTLASLEPLSAILLSTLLLNVPFGLIEISGAAFILATVFILAQK
jgi:drug/metabolite transporter (DMT)-like permease